MSVMREPITRQTAELSDLKELRHGFIRDFEEIRARSMALAAPLSPEDQLLQSMEFASPTKWHLAHTTWFFETFLLGRNDPDYKVFHPGFGYLFNSYYNAEGDRHAQGRRGMLSRPTLDEVHRYRQHVNNAMTSFIETEPEANILRLAPLISLGLNHEEQHQELILTDIKHAFSMNSLYPVYRERPTSVASDAPVASAWIDREGGLVSIGHDGKGFAFDSEGPAHKKHLIPHSIATRLVTNSEYTEFIQDGGYERPEFWLADGWSMMQSRKWHAPMYWVERDGGRYLFTLSGLKPLDPHEPVCHVSHFEADAYARWAEARLPTEEEWESLAIEQKIEGNFSDSERFHPQSAQSQSGGAQQIYGDVWEWTSSPYVAYPGFKATEGAVGEYNGKFMSGQMVLRGGACATPSDHIRPNYRNFFYPDARWQFSGIRLARDI